MSISTESVRAGIDIGRNRLPDDRSQRRRYLDQIWDEFSSEDHQAICEYAQRRLRAKQGDEESGQLEYLAAIWGSISPQNRLQLVRDALELSELSEANAELCWDDRTRREPAIGSSCPEESLMDFEAAFWHGATLYEPIEPQRTATPKQPRPKLDHRAIASDPGDAKDVAKRFGCTRNTVYLIRKEMRGKS